MLDHLYDRVLGEACIFDLRHDLVVIVVELLTERTHALEVTGLEDIVEVLVQAF